MSEADLSEGARAFVDGDVAILPSALRPGEIERLVALLIERGDVARLSRLAEARDKALSKPARRGLHLLRTRGVDVTAERHEFRLHGPYAAEAETPGLVSLIDGNGERVVWLPRLAPDGGSYDVFQAELSETRGIIGFTVGNAPKKEWRLHAQKVAADAARVVVSAEARHVRWLIEDAYERTLAAGRTPPEAFARAKIDLGPVEKPEQHPALALAPPLPLDEARPRLASLHERAEIAMWLPPDEALSRLDVEIGEIATSKLVVSPADRSDQIARVVERLADELATPAFRAQLAERLRETALIFVKRGQPDDARLATAAAALTADESVPGAANPFFRELFAKLIKRDEPSGAR
jgi:hypothetical protein